MARHPGVPTHRWAFRSAGHTTMISEATAPAAGPWVRPWATPVAWGWPPRSPSTRSGRAGGGDLRWAGRLPRPRPAGPRPHPSGARAPGPSPGGAGGQVRMGHRAGRPAPLPGRSRWRRTGVPGRASRSCSGGSSRGHLCRPAQCRQGAQGVICVGPIPGPTGSGASASCAVRSFHVEHRPWREGRSDGPDRGVRPGDTR